LTPEKFVLYADDDADDKDWVTEACHAVDASLRLIFVENGRQVLDYLSESGSDHLPALIVLDLNMPELDGRQTLKKLKTHPLYQRIPVVIVTTSTNRIDRDVCRQLGAALFLTKPDTHAEWQTVVRHFVPYLA
jgi:CheY-like chemotaxis protein